VTEDITQENLGLLQIARENSTSDGVPDSLAASQDFDDMSSKIDPSSAAYCSDISEGRMEEFLEITLQEQGSSSSYSPTTCAGSYGSSNKSSPNTPSNRSSSSLAHGSTSNTTSKRRIQNVDNEEDSNPPNRPRKQKRHESTGSNRRKAPEGHRLACPFHALDQQKYCKNRSTEKKYETCSGPGWSTIHH